MPNYIKMKILRPVNTGKAVKGEQVQRGEANAQEHSVLTESQGCLSPFRLPDLRVTRKPLSTGVPTSQAKPHGLQEAGLLAIATGSRFSPVRPKLATQEQAATFHRCQAATSWGCCTWGRGVARVRALPRFPELCPHPRSVLILLPRGITSSLIKLSPESIAVRSQSPRQLSALTRGLILLFAAY
ncbi:hypothetical protein CapIbe_012438 [Capra ibex]